MDLEQYHFSFGTLRDKNVIWINFDYSGELKIEFLKHFSSAKWSHKQKAWYLPDLKSVRRALGLTPKPYEQSNFNKINPDNQAALKVYLNHLLLKSYSPNTIKLYISEFTHLLLLLKDQNVNDLTEEDLKAYFLYCVKKLKLKERKMNGKINAIKYYFEQVLKREGMFNNIPRPKLPQSLPKTLKKSEIDKLFNAVTNLKHLLILELSYSMGLRVSEIVRLKTKDIDRDKMLVLLPGIKGKKDRSINLPSSILSLLRAYYIEYQPKEWLFEGKTGGQYSIRSVQAVIKSAMLKAKINKQIGIHGLRQSYATQLSESGADEKSLMGR